MALTIAVDFDHTYSADPAAFAAVIKVLEAAGHTCILVTKRTDTKELGEEVRRIVSNKVMMLFVGGSDTIYKDDYVLRHHGIQIDIWIDDKPEFIRSPCKIKEALDEEIHQHFLLGRKFDAARDKLYALEHSIEEDARHLYDDIKSFFSK